MASKSASLSGTPGQRGFPLLLLFASCALCAGSALEASALQELCFELPSGACSTSSANATLTNICSTHCSAEDSSDDDDDDDEENVGLAFGLVAAAGMSTAIGAAVVFFEQCGATLSNHAFLGSALGFSAGVMLYVSMAEIFVKAQDHFSNCNCLWDDDEDEPGGPYIMATICFFSGILITYMLDACVNAIEKHSGSGLHGHSHAASVTKDGAANETADVEALCDKPGAKVGGDNGTELRDVKVCTPANGAVNGTAAVGDADPADTQRLHHMGVMTALAIGIHNFPEGLATFVATLDDPSVGTALAVAIAVHNIPEGMCVAVPLYYSTGSKWKGFWLALFSGVSEIIGAALGYAFLKAIIGQSESNGDVLGEAAYAILFGLVAGMMVAISLKEHVAIRFCSVQTLALMMKVALRKPAVVAMTPEVA